MVKKKPIKKKEVTKLPKTKKLTAKEKQEKYWKEVDQQSHYLIADLLNKILPLPNLRDKKNLDLNKDTDYRTVLIETEDRYCNEKKPDKELLAEEIALWYCRLVIKALINDLSIYFGYDSSYFENLTN